MNYIDNRPKTIFCDIDGTLVKHSSPSEYSKKNYKMEVLDGVIEKLIDFDRKGYNVVLTTGRKESMRKVTEQQLSDAGIFYDQLIMGIGGGIRVLINDKKPNGNKTSISFNLERNEGISNLNI